MRPMTEIERQIDCIRKLHAIPQPCPRCHDRISAWRAADNGQGMNPLHYDGKNHPTEYACPKCKAPLKLQVPFMGPEYVWELIIETWWVQNKDDLSIEETDSLRALDAAGGYYRDPALAMSSGYFDTPFRIYSKKRESLVTEGK